MSNNPYQAPLSEDEPRPTYRSRFHAAGCGALRGSLWAAKWSAIVFGPLLTLPWIALVLIGLYGFWKGRLPADGLLSFSMKLIGGLFLSVFLFGMIILSTAILGAALAAVQEAVRYRKINDAA